MAGTFLDLVAGRFKRLTAVLVGGPGNANQIAQLDATGRWDISMMPTGIIAETVSVVTSEAISAGNFVNLYDNAGVKTARKADASGDFAKEAHGFVLAAVTSGGTATVFLEGLNSAAAAPTGLTVTGDCWLSTAGVAAGTAPSTAGYVVQMLGVYLPGLGIEFNFNPGVSI